LALGALGDCKLNPTEPPITAVAVAMAEYKRHKATNISGMDVALSRVVVCSADFAWYSAPAPAPAPAEDGMKGTPRKRPPGLHLCLHRQKRTLFGVSGFRRRA